MHRFVKVMLLGVGVLLVAAGCKSFMPKKAEEGGEKAEATAVAMPEPVEIPITSASEEAVQLFREGLILHDNIRMDEAQQKFKAALEKDADFAQAHLYLAMTTAGTESIEHREKAVAAAANVPELERLYIEGAAADLAGDKAAEGTAMQQLLEKGAGSWRAQEAGGVYYWQSGKLDEAIAALEKASALNPKRGQTYNLLTYAYLDHGQADKAMAAVEKYIAAVPNEPNPYDTKGDLLLQAGKFAEAEASYAKAYEVQPTFAMAYNGVAASRFYRDDWKGGIESLQAGIKAAKTPMQKADLQRRLALAHAAAGHGKKAETIIAGPLKATAKQAGWAPGWIPFVRGRVQAHLGHWKKANKLAKQGWASIEKKAAREDMKRGAAASSAAWAARAGDKATAQARLEWLQKGDANDAPAQFAAAHVMWAEGKKAEAAEALTGIHHPMWEHAAWAAAADAYMAAGDKDKANELYQKLASGDYKRGMDGVLYWQYATKKVSAKGTTASAE